MSSPANTLHWLMRWSEALSVGNAEIDADHQRFMLLINELNDAISQRRDLNQIKQCMQAIIDDAVAHFDHEQRLFKESGYADVENHENHHAHTTNELRNIMNGFNKHTTEYEWIAGGLRVKQILVEHLLTEAEEYRRQDQESDCGKAGCQSQHGRAPAT